MQPMEIKSDYHSASYHSKNLDTWVYTNSTDVNLTYAYNRLGQIRISKICRCWLLVGKQLLDFGVKLLI